MPRKGNNRDTEGKSCPRYARGTKALISWQAEVMLDYYQLSADLEYEGRNLFLKNWADRLLGAFFMVLLSPLFLILAAAIILEGLIFGDARGPVFVGQRRFSANKPFNLFKFRSYYIQDDTLHKDKTDTIWFINERRQTRVGKVLRKFYLDELPQLFNILCGDMSFVGPRPWPGKQNKEVIALGFQSRRFLKGGLCGPNQSLKGVKEKPAHKFELEEMLLELYMSRSAIGVVWTDVRLVWGTLRVAFRAEGL